MTIRNLDAYIKSLWDWACLAGCFGEENEKFMPTDIDGIVEKMDIFYYSKQKVQAKKFRAVRKECLII